MPIFLKHIEGSKTDQIESFDQEQIRIGRQSDNDVKFDPRKDVSVSGYHAEIYFDREGFFIKDLQSRNGTFLNSRKIEQPCKLKEGDIIQFATRGPKVVFSTNDPSVIDLADRPMAAPDSGTPTIVSSGELQPKPEKKSGFWEKLRPMLPAAAITLAALLALFGVWYVVRFSWSSMLIFGAGATLVAGGAYFVWRYWKRRKALREEQSVARQERDASLGRRDGSNLEDIKKKWAEVVRALKESKFQRRGGDDPIYALPWFVVIGEPGCGKTALLRAGGPLSSVTTAGQEGSTRNCDWRFFDKLLAIDTSGRYAFQAKESDSAAEWQELLSLLRNNRPREPINGVVVALPADSLLTQSGDKLKEQAAQLRERLDEIVQRLGIKFPVYLALTKGDRIAGFNEFFQALPHNMKDQALGYVNPDPVNNADPARFFDKAFRTLFERAEHLRLAVLYEQERGDVARELFLFPTELKSLQAPLKGFVEVLFRPSPYRETPFFRGLFLTSARQAPAPLSRLAHLLGLSYSPTLGVETSRDLFLRDLFTAILPGDRALVGRTATGLERYHLKHAAGLVFTVAASLLVGGLLTLSCTNNWLALKEAEREMTPCLSTRSGGSTIVQVLRPLDGCRQSIDNLMPQSAVKKVFMNFGLGRWREVAGALQKRFLASFHAEVLDPLDSRIDQTVSASTVNPLVIGSLIRRMQLLAQCQDTKSECANFEKSDRINYRSLLGVIDPQLAKDGDPTIDRMRRTHDAYLLWQPDPAVLSDMQSRDLKRVERWLDSGGLKEDRILESASTQFRPIRAADFWGVDSSEEVAAAYTAEAWRKGIAPILSDLQMINAKRTEVNQNAREFEASYKQKAMRQWSQFLTRFPEMEKLAVQRGKSRELAQNAGGPESPYSRVLDTAQANLSVIMGDSWERGELPPWAATLKRFAAVKNNIASLEKAGKQTSQDNSQGKEAEAVKYMTIYLSALRQVRAELSTPEKSFLSAKKAFEEGDATATATQPILKAYWALGMLRDTIGFPQGEDRGFWTVPVRQILLPWRVILDESGKYLQEQWLGLLLELKDVDPNKKGGKIIAFVNGYAATFLSQQGEYWVPKRIFDQGVPFTDAFTRYLSRVRRDATSEDTNLPGTAPQPPPFITTPSMN